jgi:hypothetical protein
MATQPKTKTDTKTKKADTTVSKPQPAKAETAKAETAKSTVDADSAGTGASEADSAGTGASEAAGGKKSSAPSRPISYFSSVASEDYRSGWDNIFGSKGKKSTRKAVKSAAVKPKPRNKLPARITLDADDLDPATREQLEAVFRRHAKKKRLNYDKLSGNGQVSWQISCQFSNP